MEESTFAFEFKNGVYISNDKVENLDPKTSRFIKRDSPEFEKIDKAKITNNHLDVEFDTNEYSHWSEIETPFLDKILDHQKISVEDKKWIYIMLGRLFYPLLLHDKWKLIIFLHGVPHSGKSELLKIFVDIIGDVHVSPLMANDNIKMVALDESPDEPLDRDTMVTSIRSVAKPEASMIMTCRKHEFFEGEHATEHLFPIKFQYSYEGEDIGLEKGLKNEKAKILRKTNEAYLESLSKFGDKEGDVKDSLSEFFQV